MEIIRNLNTRIFPKFF
jgi:hypothetical protein